MGFRSPAHTSGRNRRRGICPRCRFALGCRVGNLRKDRRLGSPEPTPGGTRSQRTEFALACCPHVNSRPEKVTHNCKRSQTPCHVKNLLLQSLPCELSVRNSHRTVRLVRPHRTALHVCAETPLPD